MFQYATGCATFAALYIVAFRTFNLENLSKDYILDYVVKRPAAVQADVCLQAHKDELANMRQAHKDELANMQVELQNCRATIAEERAYNEESLVKMQVCCSSCLP